MIYATYSQMVQKTNSFVVNWKQMIEQMEWNINNRWIQLKSIQVFSTFFYFWEFSENFKVFSNKNLKKKKH